MYPTTASLCVQFFEMLNKSIGATKDANAVPLDEIKCGLMNLESEKRSFNKVILGGVTNICHML